MVVADMAVGRVKVEIGKAGVVQITGSERVGDLIEFDTDPISHLRLGDPRAHLKRLDQIVNRPPKRSPTQSLNGHSVTAVLRGFWLCRTGCPIEFWRHTSSNRRHRPGCF